MTDRNKPAHYSALRIDPIEYCLANDIGFVEGNIIKYVTRHRMKGGIDDLEKARSCLDRLISDCQGLEK